MQNFVNLLEREETDFVDQVKKSKAFIQAVIKDKEELGSIVTNQAGKIARLEAQKQDYQKKIIEAGREKRDFQERMEQERQSGIQAVKKIEKFKRDFEKLQQDSAVIAKERNDAVSKLGREMKELERLDGERKEMFGRIDTLERQVAEQQNKNSAVDLTKNVSDLNMKLKMEIGDIRLENERILKSNEEMSTRVNSAEQQLEVNKRGLYSCPVCVSVCRSVCLPVCRSVFLFVCLHLILL